METASSMDFAARTSDFIDSIAVRLTRLADEHPLMAWCAFSLLYVSTWSLRAARKPFWFDELFTIYIARLPSLKQIWAAFTSGVEGMPPLLHLATKASTKILGETALSARVPAMLGVWIMCLCLYLVVRHHCPAIYGWVAAVMMAVAMAETQYSEEARGYGMWMGFSGLTLLCWQRINGRYRRLFLAGLALSAAFAVSSHFYALLVNVVLGCSELIRSWSRRKLDWPVLGALLLGSSAILMYLTAIQPGVAAYDDNIWSATRPSSLMEAYSFLIQPMLIPLCGAFVLGSAWWLFRARGSVAAQEDTRWEVPHGEATAAVGLQLLPFLALGVGLIVGVFVTRYTLPSLAGFCMVAAYLLRRLSLEKGQMLPLIFVLVFAAYLLVGVVRTPPPSVDVRAWSAVTMAEPNLPIVVDDTAGYLQQAYYAPPDIALRLTFVKDVERAHKASGNTSGTKGVIMLARYASLRLESPEQFFRTQKRFYLFGHHWRESWVRGYLLEAGAAVRLLHVSGAGEVYMVERN